MSNEESIIEREKKIDNLFINMRADYALTLPAKIVELEALLHSVRTRPADGQIIAQAGAELHRFKGTAGSYGFTEISNLLGKMEECLKEYEEAEQSKKEILWPLAEQTIVTDLARLKELIACA